MLTKQFNEIVDRKLKKNLAPYENLKAFQNQFEKKTSQNQIKSSEKTLILSLDDCILKTSSYLEDLPRKDGSFKYKINERELKIYVCYRSHLQEFLEKLSQRFELIIWSSNNPEYTKQIMNLMEASFKRSFFAHTLDASHC